MADPHVTGVLKHFGLVDYSAIAPAVLEYATQRGRAVHLAIQLLEEGTLDRGTVQAEIAPYLAAYEAFRTAMGFAPVLFEQPLVHPTLHYCGTPDSVGPVHGEQSVVDFKCVAALTPVYGVQTAAYKLLLQANNYPVARRYALQLKPDGQYVLDPHRDPMDEPEWRALLFAFQRQRARNGGGG